MLLHNPKAGAGNLSGKELVQEFERAGYEVEYYSTKNKRFVRALENPPGPVVVAGGDGTVRKVARRLIGRNIPMAILPLGTANNIATAFGLKRKSPKELIRALARARRVKFDVGLARGPWGDMPFFEAVGVGLFPRMISHHESNMHQGVPDAVDRHGGMRGGIHLLRQVLKELRGRGFALELDGTQLSGKYLLLQAMNINSIGPSLELAPGAEPGDGFLDVVIVREEERHDLRRHLAGNSGKKDRAIFNVHRARKMQLRCAAGEIHFDDEVWPKLKEQPRAGKPRVQDFKIEIDVLPGALSVLVPR